MKELLTVNEMAERLRVRPATLQRWERDGRVPAVRITPKVIRFDPAAVVESLEKSDERRADR